MTAFDFAALDLAEKCDAPFEFELKHPATEEPLGVFFSVVGSESATFQDYVRNKANEARRRNAKGKAEIITVEDETAMLIDAVVACLKGWRTVKDGKSDPVVILAGEALTFSPDNARKLLGNPGFAWAVRQINAATGDLGNFTNPSPKGS